MQLIAKREQEQIRQIIWLFLLGTWLLRCWQGLLLYQLHQAPFVSVEADNTFWVYHALQIPFYVIHYQGLAIILDLAWLGGVLWGLFRRYNPLTGVLMGIIFLNYFIIYNSVATHHEHTLVALLFSILLLIINNLKNFILVFAGLRYYAIFAFFSAGCWKIWRGSIFQPNQMSEILKNQHLDYLISYPDAYFSHFITYLITQPSLSNLFWYGAWAIELVFIIGCFTRKYDSILGILFLVFFLMDYLLMNLCFIEFCIFAILFYRWKGIWNYYENELKTT